jgi:hypothetical protein
MNGLPSVLRHTYPERQSLEPLQVRKQESALLPRALSTQTLPVGQSWPPLHDVVQ